MRAVGGGATVCCVCRAWASWTTSATTKSVEAQKRVARNLEAW